MKRIHWILIAISFVSIASGIIAFAVLRPKLGDASKEKNGSQKPSDTPAKTDTAAVNPALVNGSEGKVAQEPSDTSAGNHDLDLLNESETNVAEHTKGVLAAFFEPATGFPFGDKRLIQASRRPS